MSDVNCEQCKIDQMKLEDGDLLIIRWLGYSNAPGRVECEATVRASIEMAAKQRGVKVMAVLVTGDIPIEKLHPAQMAELGWVRAEPTPAAAPCDCGPGGCGEPES